jgi:hypothetical protein
MKWKEVTDRITRAYCNIAIGTNYLESNTSDTTAYFRVSSQGSPNGSLTNHVQTYGSRNIAAEEERMSLRARLLNEWVRYMERFHREIELDDYDCIA